jgi:hypothetical protein
MRSTLELLLDLVRQSQQLARVELLLVQAEIRERSGLVGSSLVALVAGLILLPVGLGLIIVAIGLLLVRFGVPLDLAFLILALAVIAVGLGLVWTGVRGLKPSRLVPAKSISQISSLFGGLEP